MYGLILIFKKARRGVSFEKIKKRNGQIVDFDSSKITRAILEAGKASGEFADREAKKLTLRVLTLVKEMRLGDTPGVEDVQDIANGFSFDSVFHKTAKAYILPRAENPD